MKQFIIALLLLISAYGYCSAMRDIPSDTIRRTNGEQIICDIKVVGEAEVVYVQNGQQDRINKKWVDYMVTDAGKKTYYNSKTHVNEPYSKKKSNIFRGKNGLVNVGIAILGVAAFLLVAGGIIAFIRFLNSWN